MTWRYGIVKTESEEFGTFYSLHEIYTDIEGDHDDKLSRTVGPSSLYGYEDQMELIRDLELMLKDAKSSRIYDDKEF